MAVLRFSAEFPHFPKNGNAFPFSGQFRQGAQGCLHGIGICVVTVVNEFHATELLDLQTRFGERRGSEAGSTLFQRDTEDTTSGYREQRILHHVQARHGQLCAAAMRALENSELCSVLALAYLGGADRSVSCARQGDFAARTRRDAIAERIVCIQDDGPPNAHSFDKGAFLISNSYARTHELDVRK